ncbi:MAG TPA: Mur ligase family protein [Patescibacteria group bacterium]|nr:Mur ligase family protein [Patescibacteria group bacterium]
MKNNLIKKYKGKKVLVWGLGLHGGGIGSASFFAKLGANVLVIDSKSKIELKASIAKLKKFKNITYHFGEHREEDFKTQDFIIRGPAIKDDNKFLKIAKKAKVKIENDVGIFFENSPAFKIGVTGTKGKSTLTALIYELLKQEIKKTRKQKNKKSGINLSKFNKVFLGGNIRKSVFDCLQQADGKSIVVLELSSFQLDHARYAKVSPNISVLTNIYPEHINFHGTFKKYEEAKTLIFKYQKKGDMLIIPNELKKLTKNVKSDISIFDKDKPEEVLKIIAEKFGISDTSIAHIKKSFKGLEGRQEFIKELHGRRFINDTTATHPLSIIYSLKRFENPILIMGGIDKGFGEEVDELADIINQRNIRVVMLPGTFSDIIKKKFKKSVPLFDVSSMKEAVQKAYSISAKNDIILLSPGGASFNLFNNEFDRGDQFKKQVFELKS